MIILCNDKEAVKDEYFSLFEKAGKICLEKEGINSENTEISLSFVSLEEIHRMNLMYRQVDRATDVLSFPLIEDFNHISEENGEILLGDVVVCIEQAEKQAEEYGHSVQRELVYLFVHSVLHLLGYDHMEEDDKAKMRKKEEEIMNLLSLQR